MRKGSGQGSCTPLIAELKVKYYNIMHNAETYEIINPESNYYMANFNLACNMGYIIDSFLSS